MSGWRSVELGGRQVLREFRASRQRLAVGRVTTRRVAVQPFDELRRDRADLARTSLDQNLLTQIVDRARNPTGVAVNGHEGFFSKQFAARPTRLGQMLFHVVAQAFRGDRRELQLQRRESVEPPEQWRFGARGRVFEVSQHDAVQQLIALVTLVLQQVIEMVE